jgi:cupin 2 domain-containing protein
MCASRTGTAGVRGNLFGVAGDPANPQEFLEELVRGAAFRVERIRSIGHTSPPGFWYEQATAEWVVLLSGAAEIRFEDEAAPRRLVPGDWINIAARRRHRVDWTDPSQPSVWLAIHYQHTADPTQHPA